MEPKNEILDKKLAHAIALIVLIGRDWLTCKDADGVVKLANPHDFVRIEIAAALKRKVRVIPVVIDGARAPSLDRHPGMVPLLSFAGISLAEKGPAWNTGF